VNSNLNEEVNDNDRNSKQDPLLIPIQIGGSKHTRPLKYPIKAGIFQKPWHEDSYLESDFRFRA
jgi:hypothetical protein